MKNISNILIACTITILLNSCEKKCPDGYSGANCEKPPANLKFAGNWNFYETCTPSGVADPGTLVITRDNTNSLKFNVIGLWTFGYTPTICDINSIDEKNFTAPRQPLYTTWDVEVTSGSINNTMDTLFFSYNIYATGSSSISDQCSSIAVKN